MKDNDLFDLYNEYNKENYKIMLPDSYIENLYLAEKLIMEKVRKSNGLVYFDELIDLLDDYNNNAIYKEALIEEMENLKDLIVDDFSKDIKNIDYNEFLSSVEKTKDRYMEYFYYNNEIDYKSLILDIIDKYKITVICKAIDFLSYATEGYFIKNFPINQIYKSSSGICKFGKHYVEVF